ncbi:NUDIX domain-containing protein [Lacticaseibacillus baoqingensis]|uniref:NUDIX domain-containing protein n=1 Tax=Lacticaseibacillus baoqingensis TaxID=2486013 RepID=A0ABW4E3X4_9LACO|nr:NUDIX hydrolase [Lacticaseibacillus baoqingensis]
MEQWDIYDINKQPTGRTMARNDWQMQPGDYHLTVLAILQNTAGRYLITQRQLDKDWAAGWWEVTGGGVRAGEDSLKAVHREIQEETGLDITNASGGYQYTYRRDNPEEQNNYFVDVFRYTLDFTLEQVHAQASEITNKRMATAEEIQAIAAQGKFLHYDSIRQLLEQG